MWGGKASYPQSQEPLAQLNSTLPSARSLFVLPIAFTASTATAQSSVQFSVDWNSPLVSISDCATGIPITEGDMLSPCAGEPDKAHSV